MTDLTRRTLLGATGALGIGGALAGLPSPATAAGPARQAPPPDDPARPAREALRRLLPAHADQFVLRSLTGAPDRFRVTGSAGRVEVAGTTPAAQLTGVHWYLKEVCAAHISWAGSTLRLPEPLPAPERPLEREATVEHRFVLNDTHDGYTAPYADWPRWERLIDVLALHGCNRVLVTPGQEAVYHRLLLEFGYGDDEARAWIPAPSHQPWWLLQNMSGYGGPVSAALLERRAELGRRITGRLRELGMSPVLPGYFGTVPAGFAARNPGARTVPQGTWAGLPRPDWLDPRTPAFAEVAAAFYRLQEELLGPAGHVKMDLLHEGGDPGDVPVPDAARAVEAALRTARPDAVWVILGWQHNPRRDLLQALDPQRTLVVDGLSDLETVTDREADFGGVPYAFGTIPNFGGRTTLGAKTHQWTDRFTAWRDKPGSRLAGTAFMPESAERDPAAFELFSELAWRREPVDRAAWFETYARYRYGGPDARARDAFAALRESAYRISSKDGRPHDSLFSARPDLAAVSGTHYATHTPAFDPAAFDTAFAALLEVGPPLRDGDAYRYDLTDAARQAIANRSWHLLPQLRAAFARGDVTTFRTLARLWLNLMRLADDMAGCDRRFLLGPWLRDARSAASGAAEAAQLERTARVVLTTWAGRATADGGRLANYANRDWHGLIADFHLPQWRAYLDELEDALVAQREPQAFDWYAVEEPWTRGRNSFPVQPVGDAHRTAQRVHRVLAEAPYQGITTVRVQPPALAPGGNALLTAEFRNVNGLSATGEVVFDLTGPQAEPQGPTSLPAVAPGGTGTARWRISAPSTPLREPLEPLPYELAVTYGPQGTAPVRTVEPGALFVAGPLGEGWRTYTTNGAVFGRLGDRFAADGGGADLWRATEEFGAAYREAVFRWGTTATVRVDRQAGTGPWARAGIVVRNRLDVPGSPGFLNLSVTPANGVVLSWDANGDGALDTYRRLAGLRAPVLLRLARGLDGVFTGWCSADGGASWRTVGTASVPAAEAVQDAGWFMSAADGGRDVRGTVTFSAWNLG